MLANILGEENEQASRLPNFRHRNGHEASRAGLHTPVVPPDVGGLFVLAGSERAQGQHIPLLPCQGRILGASILCQAGLLQNRRADLARVRGVTIEKRGIAPGCAEGVSMTPGGGPRHSQFSCSQ